MSDPALRACDGLGETYDEVSDDQLRDLLAALDDENTFVLVEHPGDTSRFAQAMRFADDAWLVEYREGSADQHLQADAPDAAAVHAFLTGWATDRPGWRDAFAWRPWSPDATPGAPGAFT